MWSYSQDTFPDYSLTVKEVVPVPGIGIGFEIEFSSFIVTHFTVSVTEFNTEPMHVAVPYSHYLDQLTWYASDSYLIAKHTDTHTFSPGSTVLTCHFQKHAGCE